MTDTSTNEAAEAPDSDSEEQQAAAAAATEQQQDIDRDHVVGLAAQADAEDDPEGSIGVVTVREGKPDEAKFHVVALPGVTILKFGRANDPKTPDSEKMGMLWDVVDQGVHPDERPAFFDLLTHATPTIDLAELSEIIGKLIEVATANPTE